MLAFITICVAGCCYILCSIDNFRKADYPHALMWAAYALANVGMLWYELNKMRTE